MRAGSLAASLVVALTLSACQKSKCERACKKAHDECGLPGNTADCLVGCREGDHAARKRWTQMVLKSKCAAIRDTHFYDTR